MRVLLISPNKEMFPPAYPIGLQYLATAIRRAKHTVKIVDLIAEDYEKEALLAAVEEFRPELIGFSIRNVDNALPQVPKLYYVLYKELIDYIKTICNVPIIIGGAGFSIFPKELLNYYGLKYGIVGEGEVSFVRFIDNFSAGLSVQNIEGVVVRGECETIYKPGRIDYDNNTKNYPINEGDLKYLDMYQPDGRRWLNIQAKRGCNQQCIYCVYPFLEGSCFRLRSPENIGEELEYMYRDLGIDVLAFVDSVFNTPVDHAIAVTNEFIKRNIRMEWSTTFLPKPEYLPQELIGNLKKAGCSVVDFSGTDTASKKMLKKMGKSYSQLDIIESSKMCKEAGLKIIHSLLLGGPGETIETIKESLDVMEQINPDALWVSLGIRIYPNTPIQHIAIKEEIIDKDDPLLHPKYYISCDLDDADWKRLISSYRDAHPNWALTCLANNYSEWVSEIVKYAEVLQG